MDLQRISLFLVSFVGALVFLTIFIITAWYVLWKLLLCKMPVFRAMFGLDKEDSKNPTLGVSETETSSHYKDQKVK